VISGELRALVAIQITRDLERAENTSGLGPTGFAELAEKLSRLGLVRKGARGRLELTESGRARLSELLSAEQKALERDDLAALYGEFLRLDAELKSAITDYQTAHGRGAVGPGGGKERLGEAALQVRLEAVHGQALSLLERIAAGRPRFATYARRLERAFSGIREGKREFVAAASVDSYHTIWFELHEDLLTTMGKERVR